jgi:hypothetical protein
MTTITDKQFDSLRKAIQDLLMSNPDMGLGDMNDCSDAAYDLIETWMEKNKIENK